MTSPRKPPVESVRVASDSQRPAWVPWVIGLVVLALLALVLLFLFDDDETDDTAAVAVPSATQDAEITDEPAEAPAEEPADVAGSAQAAAQVGGDVVVDVGDVPAGGARAGEIDVFAGQVTGPEIVGETVTANQALVQELVADEAFYVGPEVGNTILVRLADFAGEGEPESPFSVEAGDAVDLTGQVRQIDDAFLAELQLFDGADQLELGDYYVQVDQISSVR